MKLCNFFVCITFTIFLLTGSSQVDAVTLDEFVGDGKPNHLGKQLPPESYVSFKVNRLKNAKVLWVNFKLLRKMGIDVPEDGLNKNFEENILKHFAYMVPQSGDSLDSFSENVITLHADRYGGNGIGRNGGSGRAGVRGALSIKNVGKTPLSNNGNDFSHEHGGGSIKEAFQEAVWGEVTNQDLKYGGNRVLFILDTATYTNWPDGTRERRSIIVRENPLRPAHYMSAKYFSPTGNIPSDQVRLVNTFKYLLNELPVPEDIVLGENLTKAQRLAIGVDELFRRLAEQMGTAYARKIFHGAVSSSNIEIDGKYLDFASVTSLPGYVTMNADNYSFANSRVEYGALIEIYRDFFDTLKMYLPEGQISLMRSEEDMHNKIYSSFNHYAGREMVKMMGFPSNFVDDSVRSVTYKVLIDALNALIVEDKKKIYKHSDELTKIEVAINFEKIIPFLIKNMDSGDDEIYKNIPVLNLDESKWIKFVAAYREYLSNIIFRADKVGIKKDNLFEFILHKVKLVNRNREELYRENFKKQIVVLVDNYLQSGDRSFLWNKLNEIILSTRREFKELDNKYKVSINHQEDLFSGMIKQMVFDAKTGEKKY